MGIKEYNIKLTIDELVLLDQKEIREETQKIVNDIKLQQSFGFQFSIMNEILFKSLQKGKLTWHYKNIKYCQICEKTNKYITYKRYSKYHKKGDKNYDRPIYFRGIEFNPGLITIQYSGDMCCECEEKYSIIKSLCEYIIKKDLQIELAKNNYYKTKYSYDRCYICYNCKKEIYDSDIFSKTCPLCRKKEGSIFKSEYFKEINKFRMIKL